MLEREHVILCAELSELAHYALVLGVGALLAVEDRLGRVGAGLALRLDDPLRRQRLFRGLQSSCRDPLAVCARAFAAARQPLPHGDDAARARTSSRLARSQVSVYLCYAGGRLCAASRPRCCRSRLARSHVRPHANICGMLPWCPVRDRSSSWVLFRRCARCYLRSYLRPRAALCTREQAARC